MTESSASASLTSRVTSKTAREVILRHPSKWSFANQKWREAKFGAFYFLLAGIAVPIGLFATAGLQIPGGIVCGMLVGLAAVAPAWWYVEFPLARRKKRARQRKAIDAAKKELPEFTFNGGSTGRFKATDVLRTASDIVIAIDVDQLLAA